MRLKTLNGAPLCEQLDFSEDALLVSSEDEPWFRHFLAERTRPHGTNNDESMVVKWRHLEAKPSRLPSGWSQPYLPKGGVYEATPEFSYTSLQIDKSLDSLPQGSLSEDATSPFRDYSTTVDDFLEHSLILHDTLLSSQIALDATTSNPSATDNSISSSSFLSTSFETDTTEISHMSKEEGQIPVLQLPPKLAVTSFDAVPTAKHLRSIYPQTPTPTFLCVLTTPVDVREVSVKKGAYKMQLYELIVADDTASGFKVSFWFRPRNQGDKSQGQEHENVRYRLDQLKTGDILLLRNIVLTTFRDDVFGQSLNPKISKARTTVEALTSTDGSTRYRQILPLAVDEKFIRVKRWAKAHVASIYGNTRKRKESQARSERSAKRSTRNNNLDGDTLPPDTMEAV